MTPEDEPAALVDCEPGRFAWEFDSLQLISPFPVRGRVGLYDVDVELIRSS